MAVRNGRVGPHRTQRPKTQRNGVTHYNTIYQAWSRLCSCGWVVGRVCVCALLLVLWKRWGHAWMCRRNFRGGPFKTVENIFMSASLAGSWTRMDGERWLRARRSAPIHISLAKTAGAQSRRGYCSHEWDRKAGQDRLDPKRTWNSHERCLDSAEKAIPTF